jgi:hypothetical protein
MRLLATVPAAIVAFVVIGAVTPARYRPAEHGIAEGGAPAPQTAAPLSGAPTRILAHYMPWYTAKPYSPIWGWHWTMGTFDPEGPKDARATLAPYYHPLIGPYDSGDPDVLEYHALLMKLAGIDGVVIDWYGTVDFLDYGVNQRNCGSFVEQAARTGLEFAICYEDQTIPKLVKAGRLEAGKRLEHAVREIGWLRADWFATPSYLKINGQPHLLSFGQDGLSDLEWEKVAAARPITFLYLSEHRRRNAAAGAFDWPSPRIGLKAQDQFYEEAARWPVGIAVAYPRFHDIYEQAKVHASWGHIDDDDGKTLAVTLEKALRSGLPLVQISTWNDWGEGTMVEPSTEFGYRDLEVVQRLRRRFIEPGFVGEPEDLRLPHRLYILRKAAQDRTLLAQELDRVSQHLSKRSIGAATELLDSIGRRSRKTR